MDTYAQPAVLSARHHSSRPDCVVELVDAGRHPLDEMPAGFRQPHTARVALEQLDAKVFFQRLYARADTGLADAHGIRRMAEVQILGNGERLKKRCHRNSTAQQLRWLVYSRTLGLAVDYWCRTPPPHRSTRARSFGGNLRAGWRKRDKPVIVRVADRSCDDGLPPTP